MEKTFNHNGQNLTNTKAFKRSKKFAKFWTNSKYWCQSYPFGRRLNREIIGTFFQAKSCYLCNFSLPRL